MKNKMNSRFIYKLVVFFTLIVTISLSIAGYFIYEIFVKTTTPQIDAQIKLTGEAAASGIEKWLQGHQAVVRNLGENIALSGTASARGLISRHTPTDLFAPVYFGEPSGAFTREPSIKMPDGYDPRQRGWYKAASAGHDLVVLPPYISASTGKLVMTLAMPVEKDGVMLGVAGADLDLETIKSFLSSFDLGGLGYVFLVDASGQVLVHPDPQRILKPFAEGFKIEEHFGGSIASAQGSSYTAFHPLGNGAVKWYVGVSIDRDKALASVASLRNLLIVTMAALMALITPLLAIALYRLASKPITEITHAMAALSDGADVAIPSLDRPDEIGAMARALAIFKRNITEVQRLEREQLTAREESDRNRRHMLDGLAGRFEGQVVQTAEAITGQAGRMRQAAAELQGVAASASSEAGAVAGAAENATANVTEVASAITQLSESIRSISQRVLRSSEISTEAVGEAQRADALVHSLSEAAGRIGDVVNLITDIAAQTNLLALNATIEAARAGDAGKGFAVVAGEVKTLANQTAKATGEIAAHIGTVQEATVKAVEAIRSIGDTIGRIDQITAAVTAEIAEQDAATDAIARNLAEATGGTLEVTQRLGMLSGTISQLGDTSASVLGAAQTLTEQADRLQREASTFVGDIRAG
jgi:methyl-accepting chemotaxis protein